MSNCNNLFVKPYEKIECSSDITQIYSEDINLQNFSQDFLNKIIEEMCNLYNEERLKCKASRLILDTLEQFLIKKEQNPANIINFCLDNPINSIVQFILASCYRYGKWVEKDECKAFNYYQKLAEMDDSYGIYFVGVCYRYGIGVEKDEHKAFIYYQKSAKMGNISGINNVGYCYEKGIGVEEDQHKAFIYYQKSARMGNIKGIFALGSCYRYGIGVIKDVHKAFIYYQKSADMGDADGTTSVGYCYFYGIGIKEDEHKGFIYFQKAAEIGSAIAMCNVGACYGEGTGVEKDEKKAFEYFKKSAEMGHANGMYYVGEFYRQGIVVEKNFDIAFEWYLKSAIIEQNTVKRKRGFFHWMPYDTFKNLEEIGEGAFSTVFKTKYVNQYLLFETVAIKIVKDSNKNIEPFLKELKAFYSLSQSQYLGISRDEKTKDLILVLSYAKYGSLSKNLANIFKFEWKTKLKILHDIVSNLDRIHSKRYLHQDLHPGNILLKENYEAYISDLGLSKPLDEKEQDERIHGVLPYIAPEILQKKHRYTEASDIYSFGIIMVEMTTGQRSFNNYKFDIDLAIKICGGLRPKFAPGTPDCYIELANQCMNSDPKKRPNSSEITTKLYEWFEIIGNKKIKSDIENEIAVENESVIENESENRIRKQFLESDEISKNLPIITEQLNNIYISKPYNISEISAKLYFSKTAGDIEVPNDI